MKCNCQIFTCAILAFLVGNSYQNDQKFKLHSDDLMPMVGFGTYKITGTDIIKESLDNALATGYRLIDTAKVYKNEEDIGKALKELLPKYNLTRDDIFITTKLAHSDHGKALESLKESVKKLDTGYVDLYLIHFPGVAGLNGSDPQNAKLRDESWQQMVQGVNQNLTRNIGVSNYNARQLKELLDNDHGIKPAVNQVEWHPLYHQDELQELCKKAGILLQAYSSLGGGRGKEDLLKKPEIVTIAKKLNKSPAQILLRWALQQNIGVIPKSVSKDHIKNNFDLDFIIPEDDMKILNNFQPQHKYAWDPDTIV